MTPSSGFLIFLVSSVAGADVSALVAEAQDLISRLEASVGQKFEGPDLISSPLYRHLQALTSEAEKLFPAPLQPESNDRSEHSEASPAPSNEVFPVTVPPAEAGEASEAGEEGEAGEAGEEGEAMGEVEAEIWGEEEEEEEFTPVDVGCSWTLIGSLFFTMVMFYFVNYPDDDIKRYTWSIINTTLSIFTAVLTFQGIDDLVMHVAVTPVLGAFPSGWRQIARVMIGFLIFLAWYVFALLAIALASGMFKQDDDAQNGKMWVISDFMRGDHGTTIKHSQLVQGCRSKGIAAVNGVEVFVASRAVVHESYETRTKCWSTLFAHMAGFAMISAGGDLQNAPFFSDQPATSWLAILVCIFFLIGIFSLSELLYARHRGSEFKALFVEGSIEAEDDIICLAVSFMMVQSMRFTITGTLPSKLGLYHKQETETSQTEGLYVMGVLSAVMLVVAAMGMSRSRVKNLVVGTFSMGFAWAFLFATRSLFDSWSFLQSRKISPLTIEGPIVLAMTLSLFACMIIVILDRFEDNLHDDADDIHKALKNIITGLSILCILIGFTWEHTFDGCVEAISSLFSDPLAIKLFLTFLIVLIVVPAWRKYILAKVVHLEKARREQKEAMDGDSTGRPDGSSSEEESSTKLLC